MSLDMTRLAYTAQSLVPPGQGILAADESFRTIKKRFDQINVESTEETRRAYRDLLLTTPGIEQFISGVIMFDETIQQSTRDEIPFPVVLMQKGIIAGIKVDTGAKEMAGFPGEKVTEGLDGLRERLAAYYQHGARFAKWRAVITISGSDTPTRACIQANAHALARYAALCQEAKMVPIVEPEVLMDGDHALERCEEVTTATLRSVFEELAAQRVVLEGTLLKPNMVVPGKAGPRQASTEEVAEATLRCCRRTVPAAVPGIVFLSGGQSPEQATANLNAINTLAAGTNQPWELSFSFARALQGPVLETWQGKTAHVAEAQAAFSHRARCNSAARSGSYTPGMEEEREAIVVAG